jgi:hypothetical protein
MITFYVLSAAKTDAYSLQALILRFAQNIGSLSVLRGSQRIRGFISVMTTLKFDGDFFYK